jgi:hypothetical protein
MMSVDCVNLYIGYNSIQILNSESSKVRDILSTTKPDLRSLVASSSQSPAYNSASSQSKTPALLNSRSSSQLITVTDKMARKWSRSQTQTDN